jgi:predicted HTH domain antitoxin
LVENQLQEFIMPLTISDEQLSDAGITEQDARVEVACRMYDASKLTMFQAMQWSGLRRVAFESALIERGLPIFRISKQDLDNDLATIETLRLKGIGVCHVDCRQ